MKILRVLFLIIGLAITANAQKAILSGTVYDAFGAVIIKAEVVARNEKGETFSAESNSDGVYSLSLPYNDTSANERFISRYEIVVDLPDKGFEKRVIKNFMFIPVHSGKMLLDIALDSIDPEPCGYGGDQCLPQIKVQTEADKITNNILQKPLEKLPKVKNTKRKQ